MYIYRMKQLTLILLLTASTLLVGQNTAIPDANFEQALINLGLDISPIDGVIPTPNIDTVTSLNVTAQNINDLTGIEDFTALEYLFCRLNSLSSIDVSQNSALLTMACGDNLLTELDVSQNSLLHGLACDSNLLSCLNGNNINFTFFYAFNNSNLICIEVDNGPWSTANWTPGVNFFFDAASSFSTNCANPCSVGIDELTLFTVNIYPNPTTGQLTITLEEAKTGVLSIKNYLGQIVMKQAFNNTQELNISLDGPAGIYFLQVESDGQVITKKVVKQ
jgi:hypothetical protein